MGLFDDLDNIFSAVSDTTEGMINNVMETALQQYEENQKRPGIDTLTFKKVAPEKAERVRNVWTGLFGGGAKKKLADSIEEGRTTYAEVLVLAKAYRDIDRSAERSYDSGTYEYYYKIADLDGNVLREDIPAIDNEFVVFFEYNGGDSASETGCADKVDPGDYLHMFLLHYYLNDDDYYVLLTKDQFDDLTPLVKHAGSYWHCTADGVGYFW